MVASTAAECPLFVRQQWPQFLDMSLKTLSKILIAPVRKRALPDNSARLTSLAQALPRQILNFSSHSKTPDYANGRPEYRFCDEAPRTIEVRELRPGLPKRIGLPMLKVPSQMPLHLIYAFSICGARNSRQRRGTPQARSLVRRIIATISNRSKQAQTPVSRQPNSDCV